jgi:hypothetical protein
MSVPMYRLPVAVILMLTALLLSGPRADAQTNDHTQRTSYPKSIRGYKVARAEVRVSTGRMPDSASQPRPTDALLQIGQPQLARLTPLGITFELPIKIAPTKQGGRVDFLSFENFVVNGTEVSIDDYYQSFELSTRDAMQLPAPIRVFVSAPSALAGALGEWSDSRETWKVTGRVYVFGRFKKFLMSVKRVVPVDIEIEISNPLRESAKLRVKQPVPSHHLFARLTQARRRASPLYESPISGKRLWRARYAPTRQARWS